MFKTIPISSASNSFQKLVLRPSLSILLCWINLCFAAEIPNPETVSVSLKDYSNPIVVQVFKPEGNGPFPLVVFMHGRAGTQEARTNLQYPILPGHAAYWMRKGFAVIAPFRPGYGATGGPDMERSGNSITKDGRCIGDHQYKEVAANAARPIRDLIGWAKTQSWVNPQKIILVGQSVGGLTAVALGANPPSGVLAYINFVGGTGGDPIRNPGKSCFPEVLTELYASFGKTTKIPNLWLYAENDEYWGPNAPIEWHQAFAANGGSGKFIMTTPVPGYGGHSLLQRGGRLWADHTDPFVKSLGF
jgi:dienelactone hydrolase